MSGVSFPDDRQFVFCRNLQRDNEALRARCGELEQARNAAAREAAHAAARGAELEQDKAQLARLLDEVRAAGEAQKALIRDLEQEQADNTAAARAVAADRDHADRVNAEARAELARRNEELAGTGQARPRNDAQKP